MRKRKADVLGLLPIVLRWIREAVGLTQSQLARDMDISRQLVAQWESGETTPTKELLIGWLDSILRGIGNLRNYDETMKTISNMITRNPKWYKSLDTHRENRVSQD